MKIYCLNNCFVIIESAIGGRSVIVLRSIFIDKRRQVIVKELMRVFRQKGCQ
jgi:hypothetical protein